MKQIMQGVTFSFVILAVLLSVMSVTGRDTSEKKARETLQTALYETMERLSVNGSYRIADAESFQADFIETFVDQMNMDATQLSDDDGGLLIGDQDTQLQVNFAAADPEKEIMMVYVIEKITYPNGQEGLIEDSATMVFDEEEARPRYTVRYRIPQEEIEARRLESAPFYRTYVISEGEPLLSPAAPKDVEGRAYETVQWRCESAPESGTRHIRTFSESPRYYTAAELRGIETDGDYVFSAVFDGEV